MTLESVLGSRIKVEIWSLSPWRDERSGTRSCGKGENWSWMLYIVAVRAGRRAEQH